MSAIVLVDAGYLFAAGSKLLSGTNLPRSGVRLNVDAILKALRDSIAELSSTESFLRIYWYDGVLRQGPTAEQEMLADSDGVKVRLGMIAYTGRQKGVDSLIVTDLIELARNGAISDAILVSGDEDVRIGVQIAQSFGVRIHLLGIEPKEKNQSRLLRQEADTSHEWRRSDVEAFLAVGATETEGTISRSSGESLAREQELDSACSRFIGERTPEELLILAELQEREPMPRDLDRELLSCAAAELERYLEPKERMYVRQVAKSLASEKEV